MHFGLLNSISCFIGNDVFMSRIRPSLIGWVNSGTMRCSGGFIGVPSLSYGFSIFEDLRFISSKGLIINLIERTIFGIAILIFSKYLGDIGLIAYSNWGSSIAESGRILDLIMVIVVDGGSFKSLIFGYGIFGMWMHEHWWGLIPVGSIFFDG